MTIAITRLDLTAADLRAAAARTQDAKASRRMLAIALLLEGWSREAAAEACAMDRQTLRDWVHRYNDFGLAGLYNQARRNGPLPRLSSEQQAEVAEWVEQGADLARDGVVRWRCVDLQQHGERMESCTSQTSITENIPTACAISIGGVGTKVNPCMSCCRGRGRLRA